MLKIKEAEVAAYKGWKLSLTEHQIMDEIYRDLGRDSFKESDSFRTVFLESGPNVNLVDEETKSKLTSEMRSRQVDEYFQSIWNESSVLFEINKKRKELLNQ